MANYFNLSGNDNFYGQIEVRTYYNVHENRLQSTINYMINNWLSINVIFIYDAKTKEYLGSYSRKYNKITWGYVKKK